jgi:hypothetical protein
MGRYIGTADVRAFISPNGSLPATQNGLIGTCINWAEGAIDAYTRRIFAGTTGTAYYNRFTYPQLAGQALFLDQDLLGLTSLTNGDTTTIPLGSVWLEPRNEGPPYRILRLKSSYVYVWNTDTDVIVAGTWGYSASPPADIQGAAVRLAAFYYRMKDAPDPGGVSGFPEGGEVTWPRGIPDDIKFVLEKHKSRSGGIV